MGMWRNWYTRTPQKRMEQSLEVQILSYPLCEKPDPKDPAFLLVRDARLELATFPV